MCWKKENKWFASLQDSILFWVRVPIRKNFFAIYDEWTERWKKPTEIRMENTNKVEHVSLID